MKNRIKCQGCGSNLNAGGLQPRSTAACPNCGNAVTVPFPGMKAGKFLLAYLGLWVAFAALSALIGTSPGPDPVLLLPWFAAKVWIGYLRSVNIGWSPWCGLLVILPFLGALVLACHKTGEGMKKAR